MGTKLNPGKFDCYNNALPDEPLFTLLARDPKASALVAVWAYQRQALVMKGERPESDVAMCEEASACADAMRDWRRANDGRWRTEKAPPSINAELLAALKAMLSNYGPPETIASMVDYPAGHPISKARAAIAKAEQSK